MEAVRPQVAALGLNECSDDEMAEQLGRLGSRWRVGGGVRLIWAISGEVVAPTII